MTHFYHCVFRQGTNFFPMGIIPSVLSDRRWGGNAHDGSLDLSTTITSSKPEPTLRLLWNRPKRWTKPWSPIRRPQPSV